MTVNGDVGQLRQLIYYGRPNRPRGQYPKIKNRKSEIFSCISACTTLLPDRANDPQGETLEGRPIEIPHLD